MSTPTVAVTCNSSDQGGSSVAFGVYTAKLDQTEIYDGFVVPESITVTADVNGVAVLNLWPNALGVNGSSYRVTARNPDTGKKFFDASVVVPNNPCNLYQIIQNAPFPNVDSAQQALIDVQALVTIANQDVAATNADAQQTAADRLQTGEDRTAARDSAANALVSENVAGYKADEASGHANAASGQADLATNAAAATQTLRDSIIATQGSIGYLPPVAYAAGLAITLPAQTVSYAGQAYAPLLPALPFTTSGTFEAAKFRLIQGVAGVDLAAAGGSELVGHDATLNYAMGTLGGVINDMVVNVKMFPWLAKGDGVTDDRAAIQAALTATKGKSILHFPPGNYICSGSLSVGQGANITGSNSTATDWRRNSATLTRLSFTSTTPGASGITVYQADLFSDYVWNIGIKNIALVGVNTAASKGLNLENIAITTLENVSASNFDVGLYISYGMFGTYKNLNIAGCLTAALYIAGTSGTTTTQSFTECVFRQSPWGVIIESTATGKSFGNSFHGCTVESTTLGGVNVHKTCDAAFNDMYCENVDGSLFRLGLDGYIVAPDYSNISFKGGALAGKNTGGFSLVAIDIGNVNQVTVDGSILQRATNGIRCDATTRANSVYVSGIGFVQVTNLLVNCDWKLQGKYPSAVVSSARQTTTKSNLFAAWNSGATPYLFDGRCESFTAGVAIGIDSASQGGSITGTNIGAGSAPLLMRTTLSGTSAEAARFTVYRCFKASSYASAYDVPNFAIGNNTVAHQLLHNASGDTTPALLVSNLSVNPSSHAIITTKPNITQGTHFRSCRTDTGAVVMQVAANGDVSNINNIYAAISDEKLKQDIADTGPKLADLLRVRVVNYAFKSDPVHKQLGVIAQEVEAIFPGLVEATPDVERVAKTRLIDVPAQLDEAGLELEPAGQTTEDYFDDVALGTVTKSVKYSVFVPMLIKAMQEQQAMIDELSLQVARFTLQHAEQT